MHWHYVKIKSGWRDAREEKQLVAAGAGSRDIAFLGGDGLALSHPAFYRDPLCQLRPEPCVAGGSAVRPEGGIVLSSHVLGSACFGCLSVALGKAAVSSRKVGLRPDFNGVYSVLHFSTGGLGERSTCILKMMDLLEF